MARKLTLPLMDWDSAPRVEQVRSKLGGRAAPSPQTGQVVTLRGDDAELAGVILWSDGQQHHVLGPGGVVRRVSAPDTRAAPATPTELQELANDARVFAGLAEGQRVRWQTHDGELRTGLIAERCRYGAIVVADDGALSGVGFRRLWPLTHEGQQ